MRRWRTLASATSFASHLAMTSGTNLLLALLALLTLARLLG